MKKLVILFAIVLFLLFIVLDIDMKFYIIFAFPLIVFLYIVSSNLPKHEELTEEAKEELKYKNKKWLD